MTRKLRVVARASGDIDLIYLWLKKRSPKGAATWYDAFLDAADGLLEHPALRSLAAETRPRWKRKIHQALFKTPRGRRYRILFEYTDFEVRVLRIRRPGDRPIRFRDIPIE